MHEQLLDWDRHHHWHAFTQMAEYEPLVIERAEGCRLIDIEGNEYLDGVSSIWCNVHGHCHPRIDEAIRQQLDKVAHSTSLGMGNSTTIRLSKRLADLAPGHLEHVFFASDGSSAIEVALKMAFQYWLQREEPCPKKTKYIALGEAYHGDTMGSASVGGIARFHALFEPLLFDVVRVPIPNPQNAPSGMKPDAIAQYFLGQLEQLLQQHHEELAAMVIEPIVQCAAGMVMHPPGYLRGVRELTERYDVLMIADEVAVGFGRTGTLFACEQEEVVPDFLCLAKGITGGYLPLSATITHEKIWNAFLGPFTEQKTLYHGHTYSGNPLAAAAAIATLDLFEEEQTLEKMKPKIARLDEHLCRLAEHPHLRNVRQRGLLGAMELVQDKETGTVYPWAERRGQQVCNETLRRGVWLRPLGNEVYVMPPLAISIEELDQIMEAVEAGIEVATSAK